MRRAVLDQWAAFSEAFESNVDWLYLDVRELVTIGLGLLVDPEPLVHANALDFVWPAPPGGGAPLPACAADVHDAWSIVKAASALAPGGGKAFAELPGNAIRATPASLAAAARRKLLQNELGVRKYFPGWDDFPAPGQLLVMSMAWAMGPWALLHWPHFMARVNAGDWLAVAAPRSDPASCLMDETGENASFHLRNLADVELAKAAAFAVDHALLEELDVRAIVDAAKVARAAESR